jgi:hypothetical protein
MALKYGSCVVDATAMVGAACACGGNVDTGGVSGNFRLSRLHRK